MRIRSLAGCGLLMLAALFVLQVMLDGASFHSPHQQQWRAPSHHQGVARLPRRSTNGIPAGTGALPLLSLRAPVLPASSPDVLSPLLAAVFVPPRV
jgi:hypothetical protein